MNATQKKVKDSPNSFPPSMLGKIYVPDTLLNTLLNRFFRTDPLKNINTFLKEKKK